MGLLETPDHCFHLNLFTEATPDKDPKKGSDTGQSKLFTKEKWFSESSLQWIAIWRPMDEQKSKLSSCS